MKPGILRIRGRTEDEEEGRMVMYGSREASHRAIVPPLAFKIAVEDQEGIGHHH